MTKLIPLHDRIVVQKAEEAKSTKSGILIPDTAQEKPTEGLVIAVGAGITQDGKLVPLTVKPGDRILFNKWGGTEVKHNDAEYLIMKESDVLAIIG